MDRLSSFNPSICISKKVKTIQRITANVFRKHLSAFNVTDSQLSILFVISKNPAISQSKICEILVLEKSSLSRNLQRLLSLSYIEKSADGKLSASAKGLEFVRSVIPAWEAAMAEIKTLLEDEGENALNIVLNKLNKSS